MFLLLSILRQSFLERQSMIGYQIMHVFDTTTIEVY